MVYVTCAVQLTGITQDKVDGQPDLETTLKVFFFTFSVTLCQINTISVLWTVVVHKMRDGMVVRYNDC